MAISRRLNDTTYATPFPVSDTGGQRHAPAPSRYERGADFSVDTPNGSHMPIDTGIHWRWDNPLNLIVAAVLLAFLIALVGVLVS